MKLLILTQAVDLDDPVLGFFHRWIEELAKKSGHVHVICLKEGRHALPENVIVHSLGKDRFQVPGSRLQTLVRKARYAARFYRYMWKLRREYDAVFVHMNQEYVLLGGVLWRLWGKRVVLWRNHKMGSVWTDIAARLAHTICYTSPAAYVARLRNAVRMPIGIDTGFFSPGGDARKAGSILFLGRLDVVKRVEVFIGALELLHAQGIAFFADIVGDPTDPRSKYAHDVRNRASSLALEGKLAMHPAVTNEKAREFFRSHELYVNLTPSGSFDKTIGEAMACGALVVCSNDAVRGTVSEQLMAGDSTASVARAIRAALALPPDERAALAAKQRAYVEREHSLALLAEKLSEILA